MGLVAILAAASSVALRSLMSSNGLNQGSELIQDLLTRSRRVAISHAHIVEIRFFQCKDPANPKSTARWRGVQAVEILEDGTEQPVNSPTILPHGLILSGSATASPLLAEELGFAGVSPTHFATVDGFRRFRFLPNGLTDLSAIDPAKTQWFVTLFSENDLAKGDPPPNYIVLQVEPFTGTVTVSQP